MYRYYSIMRPIAPGTFPRTQPVQDVVNFDSRRFVPEINREAWGYIEYTEPLAEKQAADYELVSPVNESQNPAEEILADELGLEPDDLMDLLF